MGVLELRATREVYLLDITSFPYLLNITSFPYLLNTTSFPCSTPGNEAILHTVCQGALGTRATYCIQQYLFIAIATASLSFQSYWVGLIKEWSWLSGDRFILLAWEQGLARLISMATENLQSVPMVLLSLANLAGCVCGWDRNHTWTLQTTYRLWYTPHNSFDQRSRSDSQCSQLQAVYQL